MLDAFYIALIVFQLTLPLSVNAMWRFLCAAVCFIIAMTDVHILIHYSDNNPMLLLALIQLIASIGLGVTYKRWYIERLMTRCTAIWFILSVIALPVSLCVMHMFG